MHEEVVPNALYGRELYVLAAVVLGGGRGSILGVLLGISPYAFKMIIGIIILVAITLSSEEVGRLIGSWRSPSRARIAP